MNGDAIFDDKSWPTQFALRRTRLRVSLHFGQVTIDIDDDDTANRHHARGADMSGVDRHATAQTPRSPSAVQRQFVVERCDLRRRR